MEIVCLMQCQLLLIGNESLAMDLRVLTAIELHENATYYCNYSHFNEVANVLQSSSSNNLFTQALSDYGCKSYTESKCRIKALQDETIYVSRNYNWSSFICILALCNVIQVIIHCVLLILPCLAVTG